MGPYDQKLLEEIEEEEGSRNTAEVGKRK